MKSTKHMWKRCLSVLLVLCMVGAFILPNIQVNAADTDADLWVDPVNGNDANDGLTEAKALKTIDAAKVKAAQMSENGDVVVILKGGTYDATNTITFGQAESGRNGHTITYRSASGETAIISGGTRLTGWTLHDADKNIYVTDIPAGTELTRQFYVDGKPQRVASTETSPTDWAMLCSAGYVSPSVDTPDTNEYLILDMGADKQISSIALYAGSDRASDNNAAGFPRDFTISTSADGKNWKVQVEETNYIAPIARNGVEFVFDTVGARYIKLDVTKLGNPTRSNPKEFFLALSEIFVGLVGEGNKVNLGLVQHLNMDEPVVTVEEVSVAKGGSYTLDVSKNGAATAVGAVDLIVDAMLYGTNTSLEVKATVDGSNWTTVFSKSKYEWSNTNVVTFNTTAATKLQITVGTAVELYEVSAYGPTNLAAGATVTAASGTGAEKLTDGKFDGHYASAGTLSSVDVNANLTVDLGEIQDVGAVRLYPVYKNGKASGYLTAARISVSKDGKTYTHVMEMNTIASPNGGAQLLVFPKGVKAQYVRIEPMQVTSNGAKYCLQLQELEVVPTKLEVVEGNDEPEIIIEKQYTNINIGSAPVILGYYDNPQLTGDIIDYQLALGEAECIRDGNFNSRGLTKLWKYSELVQFGGQYVPGWYMNLGGGAEFGCIEISVSRHLAGMPLDYKVQVQTPDSNGAWITIVDRVGEQWSSESMTVKHDFETVTATALRIVATKISPKVDDPYTLEQIAQNPANYTAQFELTEVDIYSVKEVEVVVEPEQPESATIVYDKVELDGEDILGFGYYSGADLDNLVEHAGISATFAIDGNYGTRAETWGQQYHWLQDNNGGNAPALVLNTTKNGKPARINSIELAVREDGLCAPYHFVIQVTTSPDSEDWQTIVSAEEADWKGNSTVLYELAEMEIYKLRLVCFNLTPASNISMDEAVGATTTYLHINELSLFNIYDPTNPYSETICTQGNNASNTLSHKVNGIEAKNDNAEDENNAKKAIDGEINPVNNNGWLVPKSYELAKYGNLDSIEIHVLYLWYHNILHVDSGSGDGTELYGLTRDFLPTWASNSYAFIDCDGEWFIDRTAGKIYYKADGTMDDKVAILPLAEQIIVMEEATNIIFDGVSFQHTTWTLPSTMNYDDEQANTYLVGNKWVQVPAGILVETCQNITFTNCEITNMGTAGIKLKSTTEENLTQNVQITNSIIHDLSYSGIIVGEVYGHHGYKTDYLVKDTVIRNNYITRVGLDMFDSPGIIACYTNGTIIDHNEVAFCPYSGISTGWGWDADNSSQAEQCGNVQVTNNFVHDTGKNNRDGGSIYNLNASKGSIISGNYIYNSWDGKKTYENGLYLDQGSAYIEVCNNVVGTNVGYWMHMWTSSIHDNNWHDNYYVNGTKWRNDGPNNTVKNNHGVDDGDFSAYPEALAIMENAGLLDESLKEGMEIGFASQHNVTQDFYPGNKARYIEPEWGWNNVTADGQVSKTSYDSIKKTVSIVVSPNTDLTKIALRFDLEDGWTSDIASGTVKDFTNPVTYTLHKGDQKVVWTVTLKLKVVTDGSVSGEDINMGDLATGSEDTDWSVPPVASMGDFLYFDSYSGYMAQSFGTDAIFSFDMITDLDESQKDWVGISLRNQDPYTDCLNGNTEYQIMFSYNNIELHKFDGGTRTILFGELTGHTSLYGTIPNNFFHGNDGTHSIKCGAVDVEEGVRLFLYVDGNLVFDIVDTENPLWEEGYFAIYPQTQTIGIGTFTDIQLTPDRAALDEALAIVEGLVASDYTEDSYAAVVTAMAQAQIILDAAGGVTQEMVDEAYALLKTALSNLVRTDGGTGPIIKPNNPNEPGKTGDDTLLIAFIALMVLSVVGVGAVLVLNKRRIAR